MRADQLIREANPEHQLAALRAKNKQLLNRIGRLEEIIGAQREVREVIRQSIQAADPLPMVKWKNADKTNSPVSAVINFSDWQTGERIRANEVEGVNAYSWAIEQSRIRFIVRKFLEWVTLQRGSYRIDKLYVFGLADWVSGNIHKELEVTNEFPVPVAAVNAGRLLAEQLAAVAGHFHEVHPVLVGADNHGRFDKKPQAKQKTSNNWSFVVHEIARAYTAKFGNLNFTEAEGTKHVQRVEGFNFLLEHGDIIRGWAGFPYYGMGRMKGKEAIRRMKLMREEWRRHKNTRRREIGFDYYGMGHFHVPCFIEGDTIVNGALSGTTEYDHSEGRYAKPCQVAYLVHPKHGLFNFVPFWAPNK